MNQSLSLPVCVSSPPECMERDGPHYHEQYCTTEHWTDKRSTYHRRCDGDACENTEIEPLTSYWSCNHCVGFDLCRPCYTALAAGPICKRRHVDPNTHMLQLPLEWECNTVPYNGEICGACANSLNMREQVYACLHCIVQFCKGCHGKATRGEKLPSLPSSAFEKSSQSKKAIM